jgi:hypothetical protein
MGIVPMPLSLTYKTLLMECEIYLKIGCQDGLVLLGTIGMYIVHYWRELTASCTVLLLIRDFRGLIRAVRANGTHVGLVEALLGYRMA